MKFSSDRERGNFNIRIWLIAKFRTQRTLNVNVTKILMTGIKCMSMIFKSFQAHTKKDIGSLNMTCKADAEILEVF